MQNLKLSVIFLIAVTLISGLLSKSIAADSESERATLKGINGVSVSVDSFGADSTEIERGGLTRAQLQIDIELRLRLAGIKVLTEKEWLDAPGNPMLVLSLLIHGEKPRDFNVCSYDLDFFQTTTLQRDPLIHSFTSTWSIGGMVGYGKPEYFRNLVKDKTDAFINAYLSVNPKESK
jgi:hypothetical protein